MGKKGSNRPLISAQNRGMEGRIPCSIRIGPGPALQ